MPSQVEAKLNSQKPFKGNRKDKFSIKYKMRNILCKSLKAIKELFRYKIQFFKGHINKIF